VIRLKPQREFKKLLYSIDGHGYKAYKRLAGEVYDFEKYTVSVDRVQGDPFATPSIVRIAVKNWLSKEVLQSRVRRIGIEDLIARKAWQACQKASRKRGTGKSGAIYFPKPGQEILERTCVRITENRIELRVFLGLPAHGRRIDASQAWAMFSSSLEEIVMKSLLPAAHTHEAIFSRLKLMDDKERMREQLSERGLVAFVPDGAILPRRSGVDSRPMSAERAVRFRSPESLRVELTLSDGSKISGMGIRRGVTLITGGGYHGKTTLLEAIMSGIYDHVEGDGREYVVTEKSAFNIRAEDGRRVERVDISSFISHLPTGGNVREFCTEDASGSTSMAANLVEAMEAGSTLFLIDEDTSATNFMIRDARMQALIPRSSEPIVPLIDRIREMTENLGISFIVVVGGAGDYLDVADTVIAMDSFLPHDVTIKAREIVSLYPSQRIEDVPEPVRVPSPRIPSPKSFNPSKGKKREYTKSVGTDYLALGYEKIELGEVETIVSESQVRGIGHAILYALRSDIIDGKKSMKVIAQEIERQIWGSSLDILFESVVSPDVEEFRPQDLVAAINRLRTLQVIRKQN